MTNELIVNGNDFSAAKFASVFLTNETFRKETRDMINKFKSSSLFRARFSKLDEEGAPADFSKDKASSPTSAHASISSDASGCVAAADDAEFVRKSSRTDAMAWLFAWGYLHCSG